MSEPEDVQLTTTRGRRPTSTVGDRMMVGLAALALIGGALIAIGKVLPPSNTPPAAEATATPEPSSTPSATPMPSRLARPLRSFQLETGSVPGESVPEETYAGWVRALEDAPVFSYKAESSPERGMLRDGDVAFVEAADPRRFESGAWYRIRSPIPGWAQRTVDGRDAFYAPPTRALNAGWIERLVAGPNGFAAIGTQPTEQFHFEPVLSVSPDGRTWESSGIGLEGWFGMSVAHGPAGWLATQVAPGAESGTPMAWVWRSDDLEEWELLGSMSGSQLTAPAQLVGTDEGYVMFSYSGGYGGGYLSLWHSTDGVLWSERLVPGLVAGDQEVLLFGTQLGFYVHGSLLAGTPLSSYSPDGWNWADVPVEFGQLVGVASMGDEMFAIDHDETGASRTWRGTISGEQLTWAPDPASDTAFDDAVVTSIVSDGTTLMALGWERATEEPLWWIRDGADWRRGSLPEEFEGLPRFAAPGPAGFVVVGGHASPFGLDPVLWHFDGGTWRPQATPAIEPVAQPTASECASTGRDLIDLLEGRAALQVACFGDAPLSVRGWIVACPDCNYSPGGDAGRPEWLLSPPDSRVVYLSPLERAQPYASTLDAVLAPSVTPDPGWYGRYLELRGHFDDPAAASCEQAPLARDEPWYSGRLDTVNLCRNRFVVTGVRVLPDPE